MRQQRPNIERARETERERERERARERERESVCFSCFGEDRVYVWYFQLPPEAGLGIGSHVMCSFAM